MEDEGDYSTLAARDYELPRDTVQLVEIIGEPREARRSVGAGSGDGTAGVERVFASLLCQWFGSVVRLVAA